jgi:hypothetical protein
VVAPIGSAKILTPVTATSAYFSAEGTDHVLTPAVLQKPVKNMIEEITPLRIMKRLDDGSLHLDHALRHLLLDPSVELASPIGLHTPPGDTCQLYADRETLL